jgi:hypothetical protein
MATAHYAVNLGRLSCPAYHHQTPGRGPGWSVPRRCSLCVGTRLLDVGQQAGRSIGLAILGIVAWSAVASNLRSHTASAATAAKAAGHPLTAATQKQITDHVSATGFSQAFLVCAATGLLALIISLAAVRVTREDLSGVDALAAPADQARSAREE